MNNKIITPLPQSKTEPLKTLLKPPFFLGGGKKKRTVIHYEGLSKNDEEGVIQLYKQLVPGDETRTINVKLIMQEGFPAFEATLGEANFNKLKKYFGIGYKLRKSPWSDKELRERNQFVAQLRTIENAQYYIDGYKELLELVASKLCDAPATMTMLEKAKFVRMFYAIFVGFYYFPEDYEAVYDEEEQVYKISVNFEQALKNNAMPFYPEELFDLYNKSIELCQPDDLLYDAICYELDYIKTRENNNKLVKEILHFAELTVSPDGSYVSVNATPVNQTFASVRNIKKKVHPEVGVFPMERFACKIQMSKVNFDDLFQMYKLSKVIPLSQCPCIEEKINYIEGSRIGERIRKKYQLVKGFTVTDQSEIDRLIYAVEYRAGCNFVFPMANGEPCESGRYLGSIKFCNEMGYLNYLSSVTYEFEVATKIIALDITDAILEYGREEISAQELKARLGIDEQFELEMFGIEKVSDKQKILKEAAIRFALENGYALSAEDISEKLLENVVLYGNEENFSKFASEQIDSETLKRRIGFEEEFAEMYFQLSKVDISAIESKLQDMKRTLAKKGEIKKSALLISLYCFLIEEQVPCGPKNKVPKRNKGLKPSNLKQLIE